MSDSVTVLPRFCERTGSPCGTDTVHNDEPGCPCRQCMLWCREELKRRWVAMDEHRTENEKLRIALSDCANHAAGYRCTSGMCSTEFLLGVPEEVRLQIGARERDRDANKAALVRVEAERDDLLKKNHNIVRGSEENKDALRKERDAVRAEFSEAVQDIPVRGGETFGEAVRRVVAERDEFSRICDSVFEAVVGNVDRHEFYVPAELPAAVQRLVAERDAAVEATEAKRKERDDALFQCVALDKEIARLQVELDELRPKPACGNRFHAHVCTKRQGHAGLHGDGDGGEWS